MSSPSEVTIEGCQYHLPKVPIVVPRGTFPVFQPHQKLQSLRDLGSRLKSATYSA